MENGSLACFCVQPHCTVSLFLCPAALHGAPHGAPFHCSIPPIPVIININGLAGSYCSPTRSRSPLGHHPQHQTSTLAPSLMLAHAAGASTASSAPFVQLFEKTQTSSYFKGKFLLQWFPPSPDVQPPPSASTSRLHPRVQVTPQNSIQKCPSTAIPCE